MSPCFQWGITDSTCRNPLTRCGLDLWLAQETPDRPSADLDSGTKRGGKKGCEELEEVWTERHMEEKEKKIEDREEGGR